MKRHQGCIYTEPRPHENTVRRQPPTSQGRGLRSHPCHTLISDVQSPELRETKLVCLKSSSSGHPRRLMPLAEVSCKDKAAVPNLTSVYTAACLNNSQCPGTYSNCITTPGHGWNEHSHPEVIQGDKEAEVGLHDRQWLPLRIISAARNAWSIHVWRGEEVS